MMLRLNPYNKLLIIVLYCSSILLPNLFYIAIFAYRKMNLFQIAIRLLIYFFWMEVFHAFMEGYLISYLSYNRI